MLAICLLPYVGPVEDPGNAMPANGETNTTFGVFRNVCCGQEIIIRAGATFPDCSRHPHLSTIWKAIEVETVDLVVIHKKSVADPAA